MKQPSLRHRLVAAMFFTSVSALLLASVILMAYELFAYKQMMTRNLSTLAQAIAANSTVAITYDNEKDAQEILSALKFEPDVVNACLYDKSGHLYTTYPGSAPAP
jgi:uncharacterized membrane protein affecting hemolysin expression